MVCRSITLPVAPASVCCAVFALSPTSASVKRGERARRRPAGHTATRHLLARGSLRLPLLGVNRRPHHHGPPALAPVVTVGRVIDPASSHRRPPGRPRRRRAVRALPLCQRHCPGANCPDVRPAAQRLAAPPLRGRRPPSRRPPSQDPGSRRPSPRGPARWSHGRRPRSWKERSA